MPVFLSMASFLSKRRLPMIQSEDKTFQTVAGERIDQSSQKIFGLLLLSLLIFPLGDLVVWAWWTEASLLNIGISWWGACLGAFLALCGLVGVPSFLIALFRKHCIILASNCLQYATDKGHVLVQIPYRNIARMELIEEDAGKFSGIDQRDAEDKDTLNPKASETKKWSQWHFRNSDDSWKVSVDEIYSRLKSRRSH
jgi:hypothetical protein